MKVRRLIDDINFELEKNPDVNSYRVAFANYCDDTFTNIEIKIIEAIDRDEEELFLIPNGIAKSYNLEPTKYTLKDFLVALVIAGKEVLDFNVLAIVQAKTLNDGSVASVNSHLWGTGIHEKERLLYFYHGLEPENAT